MDACAVSLAIGATDYSRGMRPRFRLSFHFGLFQFLMPVLGWYLGSHIADWIQSFDHWVAFALLGFVGGKMVYAGLGHSEESYTTDPTRKWSLVMLSVATSIDALAVGFSLAMFRVNIWYAGLIIGIITAGLSLLGIYLGNRAGMYWGKRMEIVGGILLCLIGLNIAIHG